MIDENAFGVLFSNHALEEEEYRDDDLEAFAKRFMLFRQTVRAEIVGQPPATSVQLFDLGHAVYVEFSDGDQCVSLFKWIGRVRTRLAELGFQSVAVLSHGGRWLSDREATFDDTGSETRSKAVQIQEEISIAGDVVQLRCVMHPSEPFRRAMYAETATHGDLDEAGGWGVGFYADTEAVDALGLTPKNQPTLLGIAGASYFRVGR